ncbi:hypothetical protein LCGC14_2107900, partial [marine sediment metagenome]
TANGNALRCENISNAVYDAAAWTDGLNVSTAPSKQQVRDVFVSLTGAVTYKGTWNPADIYPATGVGWWYLVDTDGHHAADGLGTPARWYEIGDWIIWNSTETEWDILRNAFGDNVIAVSPGDDIQVAIDEIEAVGNGVIYLLPGTHDLSATLTIDNATVNIIIEGSNDASVIASGDRVCISVDNADSCILRNFKIDASDVTNELTFIVYVSEFSNNKVIVEDITIEGDVDLKGIGIRVDSDNAKIIDCTITQTFEGIHVINANDILLSDNNVSGTEGNIIVESCNNTILRNNISTGGTAGSGINTTGTCTNLIIEGNVCNSNNLYGIIIGITNESIVAINQCASNGSDGIRLNNSDRNIIANNVVEDNGGWGINVAFANCNDNKIGFNIYDNNTSGTINDDGTDAIRYYTQAEVDGLDHDHFPNPNGNANEQHLTAAQVAALHAVEDKTRTILMELTVNNGATIFSYGIDVDANGEGWSMGIKLPSNIDASSDIKIIYTWRCQANNTAVALKRWVSATKTDGSEVQAWNIVSAQAFNSSPSPETNTREYTETYTIGNADFDTGDMILMLVRSFEVGVDQIVKNAILEYEVI